MEHQQFWGALLLVVFTGFHCTQTDYYYVNKAKTWSDARNYCLLRYSDLATVQTPEDQVKLLKAAKGASYGMAWIGLRQTPPNWKWSNGQEATYNNWDRNAYCAYANQYGTWVDTRCIYEYPFVCYTGNGTRNYTVVQTSMNWTNAANYCREHYTDLVSILSVKENLVVQNKTQSLSYYWIGLNNNPWKWIDGQESHIRDWSLNYPVEGINSVCVVTTASGWINTDCSYGYSYYCCVANKTATIAERCTMGKSTATWANALQYCNKINRTLATAQQQSDLTEFRKSGYNVWIGLYYDRENWTWSDGENVVYTSWQPRLSSLTGICGRINSRGYWDDDYCSTALPFMCNTDTNSGSLNLTLVTQSMSWPNAQSYCRQKYTDLASIQNANQTEQVNNAGATGTVFWIGLHNDPWMWADGQNTNFSSWKNVVIYYSGLCVTTDSGGTWWLYPCNSIAPFFCSAPSTTYRTVVRFRLTGLTGSQDAEDPSLRSEIVNKLKEQLSQQTSVINTTYTWREQYGKIFQELYEIFEDMCGIPGI